MVFQDWFATMLRKNFKCLDKIEKMPMLKVVGPIVL
jgi:hypothetical protein